MMFSILTRLDCQPHTQCLPTKKIWQKIILFFFEKKEKKGNFAAANIGEKPESPQLHILLTNKTTLL